MTQKVGLIGWPVKHSVSPPMHNAAFQALGMDWQYDAMAIPPDIVKHGLREPQQHGYVGLNVTVPHKQTVMRFVTPDETARAVGAVNTIDFRDSTGTNTDVAGLLDDLAAHDVEVKGARALVLGAGGAARAAVYGLWRDGAAVTVVNRTLTKAETMISDLAVSGGVAGVNVMTLDEAVEQDIDLIINCTSAGMWPEVEHSPWVEGIPFPHGAVVYDMVYRPQKTRLMQQTEDLGGRAIGGLGMLVRQGAASFRVWTGVDPPIDVMYDAAFSDLESGT